MEWRPATVEDVKQIIGDDLKKCDDEQIAVFKRYAVEPYLAPIIRYGNLESVVVVARRGDEVLYWEDVEEGFNRSQVAPDGRILEPGWNDDELSWALNRWMEARPIPGVIDLKVPVVQAQVTLLPELPRGRRLLNTGQYRPHIVIGSQSQRVAILNGNVCTEKYLGVMFVGGPEAMTPGESAAVKLALMYFPQESYDEVRPGATFTIREGPDIVGFGVVLSRTPGVEVIRWLSA